MEDDPEPITRLNCGNDTEGRDGAHCGGLGATLVHHTSHAYLRHRSTAKAETGKRRTPER